MPMPAPMPTPSSSASAHGGTLVTLDGRALPLRRADLRIRACAGLARTVLEQRFVNPHAEPLRVNYQLPLPADGAVSGFRFRVDDLLVVGEVDRRRRARERFEQALVQGRSAAIVEQDRSSLFTQEVGNIPPGATVVVTLEIDQPLRWLTDAGLGHGGWEYRFPTVVAPRYLGARGRVADASRVAVDVADRRRPIEMGLHLRIAEPLAEGSVPGSPSHALGLTREADACTVTLADGSAGLDRDVVVRWPITTPTVGLHLDTARPAEGRAMGAHAFGVATLVPPRMLPTAVPRDLIVLLDTSGSMGGAPLAQAQRIACALVDGLSERDRVELIEFSTAPRRYARKPKAATPRTRAKADKWIRALRASGGTEMRTGILAALEGLRPEAQRQIVLITDGHIGFEHEVLEEISERLPPGSRVHTVGVGSAVNRSLTQAAARAGRGLEVVIGIGEDPEPAVGRLLARTEAPLVVDLELSGDALRAHAPKHLPDLFAASPALISVKLRAEGGSLRVRGRTADGPWETALSVPARAPGDGNPGLTALFGRESVEDLEMMKSTRGDSGSIDRRIEQLGVDFQIATRLTSWVAISTRVDVDPGEPTRREDIPQELPYGMSIEGLGLRGRSGPMQAVPGVAAPMQQSMPPAPGGAPMRSRAARASARPTATRRPAARSAPPLAKPAPAKPQAPAKGFSSPGAPPPAPHGGAPGGAPPPPPAPASPPPPADLGDLDDLEFGDAQSQIMPMEQLEAPEPVAEKEAKAEGAAFEELVDPEIEAEFDRLSSRFDDDEAPAPRQRTQAARTTLSGRIVLDTDGRLVVEVTVAAALTWRPPRSVELVMPDGSRHAARLRPGTTGPTTLQPGMQLRLIFDRPANMPTPIALELRVDGEVLIIDPLS